MSHKCWILRKICKFNRQIFCTITAQNLFDGICGVNIVYGYIWIDMYIPKDIKITITNHLS